MPKTRTERQILASLGDSLRARLLRNRADVLAAANGVGAELIEILALAERRIAGRLAERTTQTFTIAHESAILARVRGVLAGLGDDLAETLGERRARIIRMEWRATARALAREAQLDLFETPEEALTAPQIPRPIVADIPVQQIQALSISPLGGRPLEAWTSLMEADLHRGIRRAIAAGRVEGLGAREIAARIRHEFGISRQSAQTLTRTSLIQASEDTRQAMFAEHTDIIESFTWLATLDSRTCPRCFPLDGVTRPTRADFPPIPLHPNCRCVCSPDVKGAPDRGDRAAVREYQSDRDDDGKLVQDAGQGRLVRHRGDPPTFSREFRPAVVTRTRMEYSQFFESQPVWWQRSVLGPARHDLWRAGRLRLDQFQLDGRLLNLDELERFLES